MYLDVFSVQTIFWEYLRRLVKFFWVYVFEVITIFCEYNYTAIVYITIKYVKISKHIISILYYNINFIKILYNTNNFYKPNSQLK